MSAVMKDQTAPSTRAALVREIAKIRAESEKSCAALAAKCYQAEHDRETAKEALDRAIERESAARNAWTGASRMADRAIESLENELVDTAPRAIDAAIADVEILKSRWRGLISLPDMVVLSDGSRAPSPASVRDYEITRDRWQTFVDAIKELQALKRLALSEAELAKRLETIRDRVAAADARRE